MSYLKHFSKYISRRFHNQASFFFLFILFSCILHVLIAFYIGIYASPDTYSYIHISQYVLTSIRHPFHIQLLEELAATLHPPFYGIFLLFLLSAPPKMHAWLIPLSQGALLISATILMYKTFLLMTSRKISTIGGILFYIYPFNILYTTILFSETLSMFLISIFCYVLYKVIYMPSNTNVILLFLIGYILFFVHFSLITFFIISGIIMVSHTWKQIVSRKNPIIHIITFTIILSSLLYWVFIHSFNYGVYTLSIVSGRHLYNSVVFKSKMEPKKINHAISTFYKYVPKEELYNPWWVVQRKFTNISEVEMDRLFMQFSISLLWQNKNIFIYDTLQSFIKIFTTSPYLPKTPEAPVDYLSRLDSQNCRIPFLSICTPFIQSFTPTISFYWKNFIILQLLLYPSIGFIFLFITIIGIIFSIFRRNIYTMLLSFAWLCTIILASAMEIAEGRYLIPLYPVGIILSIYTLINLHTIYLSRYGSFSENCQLSV